MNWRLWLKRERLIPIGTVIVAFGAEVLAVSGKIFLDKVGMHIILWLLLLIAFDALIERVTILERINSDIRNIGRHRVHLTEIFKTRSQLPPLKERLEKAQSIDIVALSLFIIATHHYDLLKKKVKEDKCKIRLVRLNPDDENLMKKTYIFSPFSNPKSYRDTIVTAWDTLTEDKEFVKSEHVQLYTYNFPLAHGLFIVNGDKPDGKMRIEMYLRNKATAEVPGFSILKAEDPELFDTFLAEFNAILEKATLYKPV